MEGVNSKPYYKQVSLHGFLVIYIAISSEIKNNMLIYARNIYRAFATAVIEEFM